MKEPVSVWLYGSRARGDADSLSDVDLLVICDADWPKEKVANLFSVPEGEPCSISRYSWSEFRKMTEQGSLFLQHVKSEGVLLYEADECQEGTKEALERLRPYRFARRDVEAFQTVLSDVREEIFHESSSAYELAVLGTVIRHASVLGCYLLGSPCFGRTEPVRRFSEVVDLPVGFPDRFASMYQYRLALEGRRCATRAPNLRQATEWAEWAERIVRRVGDLCDEQS